MKRYIEILRKHKSPYRFLLARILSVSGLCRLLTIRQNGYRLRYFPTNLSEQLWINPDCRDESLEFIRAYLRINDEVIDVGANIGDTVITASKCIGPNGRIWAVEPHPRVFHFLLANLKFNKVKNVEALNYAVGECSGKVMFSDDRRDDMNRVGNGSLAIPLRPLDEVVVNFTSIALLKVDVEGYERQVFLGAKRILEKTHCIYFEASRVHFSWFGYTVSDLLDLLSTEGFHLFRIPSKGLLSRIDVDYDSPDVENLVALKNPSEFIDRTGWGVI